MFNGLLGCTGVGGGTGDANSLPPLGSGVTFDKAEAAADFSKELMPPPVAATITQLQGDEGATLPQAGGGTGAVPSMLELAQGPFPPRRGVAQE
jgi:hypothetical protein